MKRTEEWQPSPSFPAYEISNLGRIRHNGRLLKPFFYRREYCVAINEPRRQAVSVSTLVAEAFCGLPSPNARRVSHTLIHRNDDLSDSRAANLLVTSRRHSSELDLRRASALRDDGVTQAMIEKLTWVKAGRLRRYRRREGRAARRRGRPREPFESRTLELAPPKVVNW